ncbi:hypothetical protein J3R82DRAFT_2344 [Butyriboletus roseoflavus]|nr:hypothetical protein J3R82DRAFT_2344 [Butyriboletus roseoflavus]
MNGNSSNLPGSTIDPSVKSISRIPPGLVSGNWVHVGPYKRGATETDDRRPTTYPSSPSTMRFIRPLVFLACAGYTIATICAACTHTIDTVPLQNKCYRANARKSQPETVCTYEEKDLIPMGIACTYDEKGHIVRSDSYGACIEDVEQALYSLIPTVMSSNVAHGQSTNPWGSSSTSTHSALGSSLTDTFGQSRTHYQPGYMMSAQQHNVHAPQNAQHTDEIPTVQTKAKMNLALSRGGASHFGADSMFESSSTQRQAFADTEAPPTTSIKDVFRESPLGASERVPPKAFSLDGPAFPSPARPSRTDATPSTTPISYVIVYGYPPDKYSVTVEYFKSLGAATEPEPNTEIVNCFRIGFRDPGEAARVVRRNGEVLGGTWMIGVKWAGSAAAVADLGSSLRAPELATSATPSQNHSQPPAMVIDSPPPATMVGTPIKLAPSVAAFRKGHAPVAASPAQKITPVSTVPSQDPSTSKGMLGQVTDLFFGW